MKSYNIFHNHKIFIRKEKEKELRNNYKSTISEKDFFVLVTFVSSYSLFLKICCLLLLFFPSSSEPLFFTKENHLKSMFIKVLLY